MSNDGLKQFDYLNLFKKTKATFVYFESDVELEKAHDGSALVDYIENGD